MRANRPAPCAFRLPRFFIGFPHSYPIGSVSSGPNVSFLRFQDLFNAALREYSQKTGKDIATDPLTASLLPCNSSDAVLAILQEQAHAFNRFRYGDWKVQLMRRLKPTVDILLGLSTSGVFGEGIGLVRLIKATYRLRKFIIHPTENSGSKSDISRRWSTTRSMYSSQSLFTFSSVYSLDTLPLKAANGVSTSYDALIELFECFQHYLGRLRVLTETPDALGEIWVKIMVQLLEVLALATQQIKQGRFSESVLADASRLA